MQLYAKHAKMYTICKSSYFTIFFSLACQWHNTSNAYENIHNKQFLLSVKPKHYLY